MTVVTMRASQGRGYSKQTLLTLQGCVMVVSRLCPSELDTLQRWHRCTSEVAFRFLHSLMLLRGGSENFMHFMALMQHFHPCNKF